MIGIDRAHQVLLGTSKSNIGTHMYANPFKKKSNPCLRYPTCSHLFTKPYYAHSIFDNVN